MPKICGPFCDVTRPISESMMMMMIIIIIMMMMMTMMKYMRTTLKGSWIGVQGLKPVNLEAGVPGEGLQQLAVSSLRGSQKWGVVNQDL